MHIRYGYSPEVPQGHNCGTWTRSWVVISQGSTTQLPRMCCPQLSAQLEQARHSTTGASARLATSPHQQKRVSGSIGNTPDTSVQPADSKELAMTEGANDRLISYCSRVFKFNTYWSSTGCMANYPNGQYCYCQGVSCQEKSDD